MKHTGTPLLPQNCPNHETGLPALSDSDLATFGRSNGLGLRRKSPETYAAVVRALKAGCSIRETAGIFKVNKNTVHAICYRELGADGVRQATIRNLRQVVHEASEDLLEDLAGLKPTQKALVMGIACDKLAVLEGARQDAALHVGQMQVIANISHEDITRLIESARMNQPTINV